jgi:hypothetical protein
MFSENESNEITDELINEIDNSFKKLNEIINSKKNFNERDIKKAKYIFQKNADLERSFSYKLKDYLIEDFRNKPINFFYDFVNEINGEKFKLIDRLKPEIYQAVFVENQVWFDAVYIVKGILHPSVLFKINFFTSEVKRNKKNKIMKLSLKDNLYTNVSVDGVLFYHHQVVAATFLTGYQPNYYVDHIDGNHVNNNVTNLRWVTPSVNGKNKHRNIY